MWRPEKPLPPRFTEESQPANSAPPATPAPETNSQPPQRQVPGELSIGEQLAAELDTLNKRERQIRDVQDLALRRVAELTPEQLRRILEFMI